MNKVMTVIMVGIFVVLLYFGYNFLADQIGWKHFSVYLAVAMWLFTSVKIIRNSKVAAG